jgi:hypothetical protein
LIAIDKLQIRAWFVVVMAGVWLDFLAVALTLMVCGNLENFRLCMIQYHHMAHFLLSRNLDKKMVRWFIHTVMY